MTGSLATTYADPSESPGLAIWHVTNAWQRAVRGALAPFGLTHVQFVLLATLTSMDRTTPITQGDLAAHAGTDVMMTSQVLRALESKHLIDRGEHPTDGRARVLEPTPEGRSLAGRANLAVEAADRAYFAVLGDATADFLHHLHLLDAAARPSAAGEHLTPRVERGSLERLEEAPHD
jgi:DNA-binding MarR family transcriptional regulator